MSHNARSVAQVALVDEWGRPVFNVFVKQDLPVSSYITELTGLSKETLEQYGMPMGESPLLCALPYPDLTLTYLFGLSDLSGGHGAPASAPAAQRRAGGPEHPAGRAVAAAGRGSGDLPYPTFSPYLLT